MSGCEIYAFCEPCPMCLAAICWAGVAKAYYADTKEDTAEIGFDDSFLYEQIALKPEQRIIPTIPLLREEALESFEKEDL